MNKLYSSFRGKPWIILGEFNETLDLEEHDPILLSSGYFGHARFPRISVRGIVL